VTASPRLLTIMGSGETAPTLAKVHRALLERLGPGSVTASLIDTPYGFQENADDISARTVDYFRESVGADIAVASLRSTYADPLLRSTAVARIRGARYVFAGPGSPSYALRQWRGSEVPALLADKLASGGAITFASAAALTLGIATIPVYEIYKAGEPPHWLEGLDLLSALGLTVAVVPHYDNAEGGNHDTRFCYLGERRLEVMERDLPDDAFVLGVDSHTALTLDADAGSAAVAGLGGVTVRARGRSSFFPSGSTIAIAELVAAARRPGAGAGRDQPVPGAERGIEMGESGGEVLGDIVGRCERDFEAGLEARDPSRSVRAILELEHAVIDWSRDTGLAAEFEHARAVLRSLIVRLGEAAADGVRDPREAVEPFVDALLDVRVRARGARDWATADLIRDRLVESGIEVHDSPDGTSWEVSDAAARSP
jgi:cyanophycinase-like exopeptidase